MARTVQVHLVDDIDGTPADETVVFALDGVNYEIDVSSVHATELRGALEPFRSAARKSGRAHVVTSARPRGATSAVSADRNQNKAIRAWAKRKKIELNSRGRIPRTVVEQFEAEAGR